ncbi:hypothetical protein [Streptomyces coeruleorubidus]|uniref:hypothetical protein n=1 Tax=Streptomyces coeruleorubidus TaxID=116188 RepID=UPI0034062F7F
MWSAGRRRTTALLLTALALFAAACGAVDADTPAQGPALPADAPFTHPGALVDGAQLDAVRDRRVPGR